MLCSLLCLACNGTGKGLNAGGSILLYGEYTGELFGSSLDFAGDLNGDGNGDIAVGAPDSPIQGDGSGTVYVFFGPFATSEDTRTPDMRISGRSLTGFGRSVAGSLDVNADGLSDLVISSAKSVFGSQDNGDVFIYFGGSDIFEPSEDPVDGFNEADIIVQGSSSVFGLTSTGFGSYVEKIGDFDRDGIDDLAVSAPKSSYGGLVGSGALFIFLSGRSLGNTGIMNSSLADYVFTGNKSGAAFARSFDYALNLDGQGDGGTGFSDDFVVGSPAESRAYVYLGPSSKYPEGIVTSDKASRALQGHDTDIEFGSTVSHLLDYDGDQIDDMAVSSKGKSMDKVYIFNGRSSEPPLGSYSIVIQGQSLATGPPQVASIGSSTAGDLVIGAPLGGLSGLKGGAAFIFSSGRISDFPPLGMTAVSILESGKIINNPVGLGGTAEFGATLSGDGDINGDGFNDLLIGAAKSSLNGIDSGFALLVF